MPFTEEDDMPFKNQLLKMLSDLGRGEVQPYYMVSTVHHVLGSVQLTTSVVGWAKQHSTMT